MVAHQFRLRQNDVVVTKNDSFSFLRLENLFDDITASSYLVSSSPYHNKYLSSFKTVIQDDKDYDCFDINKLHTLVEAAIHRLA